jgi:hypothetical protein
VFHFGSPNAKQLAMVIAFLAIAFIFLVLMFRRG